MICKMVTNKMIIQDLILTTTILLYAATVIGFIVIYKGLFGRQ